MIKVNKNIKDDDWKKTIKIAQNIKKNLGHSESRGYDRLVLLKCQVLIDKRKYKKATKLLN